MLESNTVTERILQLPSDQDASGRTLGEAEIKAVTEAINTGTLTSTKGRFVSTFEKEFANGTGELSMGMSHDFEVAIEEGATVVRVGTAIFGLR